MNEINSSKSSARTALDHAFENSLNAPSLALIMDAYLEGVRELFENKRRVEAAMAQAVNRQTGNVAKIWALHCLDNEQSEQLPEPPKKTMVRPSIWRRGSLFTD